MSALTDYQDMLDGCITFEFADGRRLRVDRRAVEKGGLEAVLSYMDRSLHEAFLARVPVYQGGRRIGTLSAGYHPALYRPRSVLYDARSNDFVRTRDGWEADRMLGFGDLSANPDFRWDDEATETRERGRLEESNRLLLKALAAGAQSDETSEAQAQSEGRQSGPKGNAQPLSGDHP